jgi:hypothetical protein
MALSTTSGVMTANMGHEATWRECHVCSETAETQETAPTQIGPTVNPSRGLGQSSTGEPLPKRMRMLTLPTQPSTQALNASTQRANAPNAATYTTHEHHTHTRGTLLVSHKQCDRAVGGRAAREENRTKRAVLFLQRTVLKTRFLTVSHVIAGIDEKGFSVCFAVEGVGLRVSG